MNRIDIENKECYIYEEGDSQRILIQFVDDHDLKTLNQEISLIKKSGHVFTFVAVKVKLWNQELTPWSASAVYGKEAFGNGADKTVKFLIKDLIPYLENKYGKNLVYYLGGYSLAGLFALYCGYQTNIFKGIAACSPSVWYKGWVDYINTDDMKTENVYLSLGKKESKTRHPLVSKVEENIKYQQEMLKYKNTVLEWNDGNHFQDNEKRMAEGFIWLLAQ
ncbi:alpha/beta hydrolase-fold protein [Eggerthia catenaformis]|uniref:alpha/beta hydrolase-fold protein n=1 Tax=Eggerthia catenaformis TaxID=31973 RepID=UPI00248D993D|nr:alpha/beta hydrolase-fold protein [Eggerthia catenaformis]